ncbi:MAG: tetratricopeptide repeat protein [Bacteroidota bacterium]|nr:tetratricopeptide repeat protein [Bacteroidota bacterium]
MLEIFLKYYKKNIKTFSFIKIIVAGITILLISNSCIKIKSAVNSNNPALMLVDHNTAKEISFDALYFDALKAYLVEDDNTKAIYKLQRCQSILPDNPAILFKLGELYFKENRVNEAQKMLEKATSIQKDNIWYWLLLSDIYKYQKDYKNAIEVYKIIIELDKNNLRFLYDLSNLYLISNSPSKAIKVYNNIENQIGITPEISIQKKKIFLKMNKFNKAVDELQKLIDKYPKDVKYLGMLIDLYIANGKEDKVPALYERILEIEPENGKAQLVMADIFIAQGKTKEAEKELIKAFSNEKVDVNTKISFLVVNYIQKGIKDEDISLLKNLSNILVEKHPLNPKVYAFHGDLFMGIDEKEQALNDYKKALTFEKSMIMLWQKVIDLEFKNSNYDSVVKYTSQALDYFPNSSLMYFYNGVSHNQLRNYSQAKESLEAGLDFVIANPKLKYQFFVNLGEINNSLKSYTESDKYFDKAIEIDSLDPYVLNNYAYYLSLRKVKLDKAEKMSKVSLEKMPENPAYLDTYGWILFLKGDYKQAKKYVGKALEQKPWDAELLEHYGDILFKLNDKSKAIEYWKKAVKKGSVSKNIELKIKDKKLYE